MPATRSAIAIGANDFGHGNWLDTGGRHRGFVVFRWLDNPETYRQVTERIPLGRVGGTGDLAGAALFFASDASSFVTGQILGIDGGRLAAAAPVLEVQVHAARGSGVAHQPDDVAGLDPLAVLDEHRVHVAVVELRAALALHDDLEGTVALQLGAVDDAVLDGVDRGPALAAEVDPRVGAAPTVGPPALAYPELLGRADPCTGGRGGLRGRGDDHAGERDHHGGGDDDQRSGQADLRDSIARRRWGRGSRRRYRNVIQRPTRIGAYLRAIFRSGDSSARRTRGSGMRSRKRSIPWTT